MAGIIELISKVDSDAQGVALLSAYDSGFSANVALGAKAAAGRAGFDAKDFKFKSGDHNLVGLVKDVKEYKPDLILGMGRAEDDILVAKGILEQGIRAKAVGLVVASIKLFYDTFGQSADGFVSISQWERGVKIQPDIGPSPSQFSERFKSAYGKEPDYVAAQGYHIGLVVQKCILQSASLDDASLREAAKKIELKTFYGRFKTDSSGNQRGHETVVVQWQGGKKVIVHPECYSEARLIYPL